MPFIADDSHKLFCSSLVDIGSLKYGEFTLPSGRRTSYYIDLRLLISYPQLIDTISQDIAQTTTTKHLHFDCICGVPYAALPLATMVAVHTEKPMLLRRKQPKSYGTKMLIEGKYKQGDSCLLIDDVIAEGVSIYQTILDIESVGMVVKDIIVVVDREETGVELLKSRGYNVHSLYTISQITEILHMESHSDLEFVKQLETEKKMISITNRATAETNQIDVRGIAFEKRLERSKSMAAVRLFTLMSQKNSNLCVAADVLDMDKLLTIANQVGPHICVLKIHTTLLENYSNEQVDELKRTANLHQFLIMEDRKLVDTGNAVRVQFSKISKWATLVTAHPLPGFGLLEAIRTCDTFSPEMGIFLIAELRNENRLISSDYTKTTLALAKNYPDLVAGVIGYSKIKLDPGLIQMTPVINNNLPNSTGDLALDIDVTGDIIVIGKPIYEAQDPGAIAGKFRERLWENYLNCANS